MKEHVPDPAVLDATAAAMALQFLPRRWEEIPERIKAIWRKRARAVLDAYFAARAGAQAPTPSPARPVEMPYDEWWPYAFTPETAYGRRPQSEPDALLSTENHGRDF